jgi:hypothetical protein
MCPLIRLGRFCVLVPPRGHSQLIFFRRQDGMVLAIRSRHEAAGFDFGLAEVDLPRKTCVAARNGTRMSGTLFVRSPHTASASVMTREERKNLDAERR